MVLTHNPNTVKIQYIIWFLSCMIAIDSMKVPSNQDFQPNLMIDIDDNPPYDSIFNLDSKIFSPTYGIPTSFTFETTSPNLYGHMDFVTSSNTPSHPYDERLLFDGKGFHISSPNDRVSSSQPQEVQIEHFNQIFGDFDLGFYHSILSEHQEDKKQDHTPKTNPEARFRDPLSWIYTEQSIQPCLEGIDKCSGAPCPSHWSQPACSIENLADMMQTTGNVHHTIEKSHEAMDREHKKESSICPEMEMHPSVLSRSQEVKMTPQFTTDKGNINNSFTLDVLDHSTDQSKALSPQSLMRGPPIPTKYNDITNCFGPHHPSGTHTRGLSSKAHEGTVDISSLSLESLPYTSTITLGELQDFPHKNQSFDKKNADDPFHPYGFYTYSALINTPTRGSSTSGGKKRKFWGKESSFLDQSNSKSNKSKVEAEMDTRGIRIARESNFSENIPKEIRGSVGKKGVHNRQSWINSLRREGANQIRYNRELWLEITSFFLPWEQELKSGMKKKSLENGLKEKTVTRMRLWVTHSFLGSLKTLHDQDSIITYQPVLGIQKKTNLEDLLMDGWKFLKRFFEEIKTKMHDVKYFKKGSFRNWGNSRDFACVDVLFEYLSTHPKYESPINLNKMMSDISVKWYSSKGMSEQNEVFLHTQVSGMISNINDKPASIYKEITYNSLLLPILGARRLGNEWIENRMRDKVTSFFEMIKNYINRHGINKNDPESDKLAFMTTSAIYRAQKWLLAGFFGSLLTFNRDKDDSSKEIEIDEAWEFMKKIFQQWLEVDPSKIDKFIYRRLGHLTMYEDLLFLEPHDIFMHYFSVSENGTYTTEAHLWRILAQWYNPHLDKSSGSIMDDAIFSYKKKLLEEFSTTNE